MSELRERSILLCTWFKNFGQVSIFYTVIKPRHYLIPTIVLFLLKQNSIAVDISFMNLSIGIIFHGAHHE